jgi:hypothetical protein
VRVTGAAWAEDRRGVSVGAVSEDALETPEPDATQALGAHVAVAIALVVAGTLGFFASASVGFDGSLVRETFDLTGVPLPEVLALSFKWRIDLLAPLTGFLGAAIVLLVAGEGPRRVVYALLGLGVVVAMLIHGLFSGPVLAGLLIAIAVVLSLLKLPQPRRSEVLGMGFSVLLALLVLGNALTMLGLRGLQSSLGVDPSEAGLPRGPGQAAEIAEEVAAAFQQSLARGTGEFVTPEGRRVAYLMFTPLGDAAPEGAAAPPAYSTVRTRPTCLVLPWGEQGNTKSAQEPILFFPHGDPKGVAPARVDAVSAGASALWSYDLKDHALTAHGTPALRYPAVLPVRGAGEYSYALRLKRVRLATRQGGSGPQRVTAQTPFSDELLELKIQIFWGYVSADAAADPIPRHNLPVRTFITVVKR